MTGKANGPITVVYGCKIPVAILQRFLETNSVEPTGGYPPFYHRSDRCDVNVDKWELRQAHRRGAHGLDYKGLFEL